MSLFKGLVSEYSEYANSVRPVYRGEDFKAAVEAVEKYSDKVSSKTGRVIVLTDGKITQNIIVFDRSGKY